MPRSPENEAPGPFERMEKLAKQVMSVPKSELDKREREWRAERKKTSASKKRVGLR
jgi:hypothetical protein